MPNADEPDFADDELSSDTNDDDLASQPSALDESYFKVLKWSGVGDLVFRSMRASAIEVELGSDGRLGGTPVMTRKIVIAINHCKALGHGRLRGI
ncbi:hypothetical protein SUGI_0959660 [Cryptomeria japonica]|nr:hypothetical protein SUGI_0959660 [Cryptomeria japonica]